MESKQMISMIINGKKTTVEREMDMARCVAEVMVIGKCAGVKDLFMGVEEYIASRLAALSSTSTRNHISTGTERILDDVMFKLAKVGVSDVISKDEAISLIFREKMLIDRVDLKLATKMSKYITPIVTTDDIMKNRELLVKLAESGHSNIMTTIPIPDRKFEQLSDDDKFLEIIENSLVRFNDVVNILDCNHLIMLDYFSFVGPALSGHPINMMLLLTSMGLKPSVAFEYVADYVGMRNEARYDAKVSLVSSLVNMVRASIVVLSEIISRTLSDRGFGGKHNISDNLLEEVIDYFVSQMLEDIKDGEK